MQNHKTISQSIWQAVNASQIILLFSHRHPDGDTLGSNFAFSHYLKSLGKTVTSFCIDSVPTNLKFLPNSQSLTTDHLVFTKKYDLVIALDSGSLDYAGTENLLTALPAGYTFINIDHHASNNNYGQINLVITTASSTAEVIYRLLKDWQINFDSTIATCLACGLITDTGGFKNAATSYLSLEAAADLSRAGANLTSIMNQVIKNKELSHLRLWGKALERLNFIPHYNLVYTFITQADFSEDEIDESGVEGLSNFLNILNEGQTILVLREGPNNIIKGSMRTSSHIDLTKFVSLLGGGGHKKAAGFSLPGRLDYVNNKLKVI